MAAQFFWVSCAGGTEQKPRVSCGEFDLGAVPAIFGWLVADSQCESFNEMPLRIGVFVSVSICSLHPSVSGTWQPEETCHILIVSIESSMILPRARSRNRSGLVEGRNKK